MVRQRIYGIMAAYEVQNDHDTRRSDPIVERRREGGIPAQTGLGLHQRRPAARKAAGKNAGEQSG
jgi:hypothetical protein